MVFNRDGNLTEQEATPLKNLSKNSGFSKMMHIGILVKDVEQVAKRLESMGIGPFEPMTEKPSFENKPAADRAKGLLAKVGDTEIELFTPPEGDPLWKEFLKTKVEGIHHLGFLVDNLDTEVAKLAKNDITALTRGKSESTEWVDYDFGFGGTIVQLLKR
jgi:methylmalonyl-CoA/ethylmalonyl-CoA epimerase